jgi:hypothetical protein
VKAKTPIHILPTASNLLGFSVVVLASLRSLAIPHTGFLDKLVVLLIATLATSCVLSFLSIRNEQSQSGARYENIADILFLGSLAIVVLFSFLLVFDFLFLVQ